MFKVVRVLLLGGLVGKMLGVSRELIFAWLFGTGPVASAFRLAQSAFLIPLHGLISETINSAFTPTYAANRVGNRKHSNALFTGLYSVLLITSVVTAILLIFTAELWIKFLAPGFDIERAQIAKTMLQILAFSLPTYVIACLFASVDLAMGRGQLNASRASLQSIGLILGTLAAYWTNTPSLIAVGFVLAYFVLAFIGGRVALNEELSLRPVFLLTPEIKSALLSIFKIVRVLIWIPIAFQVNAIIERRVASQINVDAMAALDYARFMTDTLIILVAMPFGVAGLSTMASMTPEEFRNAKLRSFRALLYLGIPISAVLFANANSIVTLVFQRGAFGANSVLTTADILSGMAIGIWGQLLGYAGAKFLSARGRNSGALVASVVGLILSICILLTMHSQMGTSVLGLAASVQGIAFGGFVLWRLNVLKDLRFEIFSLAILALMYVAFANLYTPTGKIQPAFNFILPVIFWASSLACLPWHRKQIISTITALRK